MKFVRVSLSAFFLLASAVVFAQNATISGTILFDEDPVEFATVGLTGTNLGAISDSNGDFEVKEIRR